MSVPAPHIIRSRRKTVSLQITTHGELVVKAPLSASKSTITSFVDQHTDWIVRTMDKVHQRSVIQKKQYIQGETFLFLGEVYTFTLSNNTSIILLDDQLSFPKALVFRAKKELETWYRKKALEYISSRVIYFSGRMNTTYKAISVADTKSRWGACSVDNRLQFNWRLIMAPHAVLDSVVVHELAHTIEKNHSPLFWSQVLRVMPGYKAHRAWINHNANRLVI